MFREFAYLKADLIWRSSYALTSKKLPIEQLIIMHNCYNYNLDPSGPLVPDRTNTSRAPRRPPLPPLASYATEPDLHDLKIRISHPNRLGGSGRRTQDHSCKNSQIFSAQCTNYTQHDQSQRCGRHGTQTTFCASFFNPQSYEKSHRIL